MLWQQWSQQEMGKLVADIIVETLQNAGVKHSYGVVGDTLNLIARSSRAKDFLECDNPYNIGMTCSATRPAGTPCWTARRC
jgi:hypothetical protein